MIETLDDFTFDEDLHEYRDELRVLRPSVTETLKRCSIFDYSMVDPALLERKRVLGQNVHFWTAEVDRHGLENVDPFMLTELERGYGEGWIRFCAHTRPRFIEIEKQMVRTIAGLKVGGTPDRIAIIGQRMWVLDIKCSAMMHPGWGLQLADYEMMYTRRSAIGGMGRMIIRLTGDGKYSMRPFSDHYDGVVAIEALKFATNPSDTSAKANVDAWRRNMRIYRDAA